VPLATALCKNLPAEHTQRQFSRPKLTRVAVPIEEEEEVWKMLHVKILALRILRGLIRHHKPITCSPVTSPPYRAGGHNYK
jgi:hypothetical protein